MPEMWDVLDQHGNKTGRRHERGKPMPPNDYMLIVHVWKINTRGEWLVDQRAPRGNALDYKWETTGGCAISGDTSLAAAIRETREELGITLHPDNGRFYRRVSYHNSGNLDNNGDRLQSFFVDVWVFACDCDVSDLTFQKEETLQALWATPDKIRQMMASGEFLTTGRQGAFYPYFEDMVAEVGHWGDFRKNKTRTCYRI